MKKCSKCGAIKPHEEFHRDKRKPDGRMSQCRECKCEWQREYRRENPELVRATQRAAHRRNYSATVRRYQLQRRFGITVEQYEALLESQGGVCAICRKPESTRANNGESLRDLSVDHDHTSGAVRGLLCAQCNKGLGAFKDNIDYLLGAAEYLRIESQVAVHQVLHGIT